ncbi:MAG: hemolysin III family protein [Oscillospiraceae bacterium]|nr:hemolysin III family protein [Oscillospiraceae bacterium]
MTRKRLCDRILPIYSQAEDWFNAITHGLGVIVGIVFLMLAVSKQPEIASWVYGLSMIAVYTVSALYHGWKTGPTKKILQVMDHCTIYTLIAGTYTPILLFDFIPYAPAAGWGLLAFQWVSCILCILLNIVGLRGFRGISMVFYVLMGWAILFVAPYAFRLMHPQGLLFVFLGGVSYTVGAILYGIGSKKPWFHGIFHLFVLGGSILQFIGIYRYIL